MVRRAFLFFLAAAGAEATGHLQTMAGQVIN
jgi:hypothetical protein